MLASFLRKKGPAYALVDGEAVHDIPPHACRGRSGTGSKFRGYLDEERGVIRVDCEDDLAFWLEIDLSKMPRFAYSPEGPEGKATIARLEAS
jgi:hypothetical protein